jgi:methionine synthase II (cobalamin-independent)
MFATLLGGLPWPDGAKSIDDAIETAIRAQEDAGIEPVTDGRFRDSGADECVDALLGYGIGPNVVGNWSFAAGQTARAVKQALPGPYTLGWAATRHRDATDRADVTVRAATWLRELTEELAAAGCPLVEIEETEAHRISTDEVERGLFREAHERLIDGVDGTHLSLSIAGAAADRAGIETILAAPYASLAVDLISGPDNWNLVTRAPQDRGIVVGALSARTTAEAKEVLLWGVHYAASTAGRGLDRVGLGSAGSWAALPWAEAERRLRVLGEAARLAAMPPSEELRRSLDPRSVSARRAGLGHDAPGAPPRRSAR